MTITWFIIIAVLEVLLLLQAVVMPSKCQSFDPKKDGRPNLLFIMTDQQRFDAIGRTQSELHRYDGKLKIRTPNLDKLSRRGAYFTNAYTQSPVCVPARGTIFTGCTIERTGIQANGLEEEEIYSMSNIFEDKIKRLRTFDQVLVEDYGYVSEYYGKWHLPQRLRHEQFNDYDYETDTFMFTSDTWSRKYRRYANYFQQRGNISKTFHATNADAGRYHQQEDTYTKYPYTPMTELDSRYDHPTNTRLNGNDMFNLFQRAQGSLLGNYSLSNEYTTTYLNGDIALKAIKRLTTTTVTGQQRQEGDEDNNKKPFVLTVSFHKPHPPFIPSWKYLDYYWNNRHNIFIPPNVDDNLTNNAYFVENEFQQLVASGYKDEENIRQWTALYYALVQEVDAEVGKILQAIDDAGITNNTLIVFTSDHGEMLGSHGMRDKSKFYDDASKVPLFIVFPGRIEEQSVITEHVGHLDLFATILDYLLGGIGTSTTNSSSTNNNDPSNSSDGISLRRFIERQSFNEHYDENVIVSEWDFRRPTSDSMVLTRDLDSKPAFLIKKGHYKLMMFKDSTSDKLDIMFNLENDPYEVHNLLGTNGMSATNEVIGKAEHLKCLLIEWMQRMDGGDNNRYYSDPKYNAYQGTGDINEVTMRRKWRAANIWVSDSKLNFGPAVWDGSNYVRNEYLYIGRTATTGNVTVSLYVTGVDSSYFELDINNDVINSGEYIRVKVSYKSVVDKLLSNDTYIFIHHDAHSNPIEVCVRFCSSSNDSSIAPTTLPAPSIESSFPPSSIMSAVPTAAQRNCATCHSGESCFELHILFDEWPADTSWTLVNDAGNTKVVSGKSFGDSYANSLLDPPIEKCLSDDSSYTFTITDAFGDGLCGHEHHDKKGCGYYKIFYDGQLVKTGGNYGKEESVTIFPANNPTLKPTIHQTNDESPNPMLGPTPMPTLDKYGYRGDDVSTIIDLFSDLRMTLYGINRGRALVDGPGNPVLDKASIDLWGTITAAYVEEFYRSKADEWNIDNIKTKFTVTKQEITEGGVRLEYEQSLEYRIRSPVNLGVVPDKRDLVEGPFLTESQRAKYVQMLRKARKDDNYGPLAGIERTSAVQIPVLHDMDSDTYSLSSERIIAIAIVAILSLLLICICTVIYCRWHTLSYVDTEAMDDGSLLDCFYDDQAKVAISHSCTEGGAAKSLDRPHDAVGSSIESILLRQSASNDETEAMDDDSLLDCFADDQDEAEIPEFDMGLSTQIASANTEDDGAAVSTVSFRETKGISSIYSQPAF